MVERSRSRLLALGLGLLVLPLVGCENSGFGKSLQDSLAADPRLTETTPAEENTPTATPSPQAQAELPADFPAGIPRYPNAALQEVRSGDALQPSPEVSTVWQTSDASDRVFAFYREQLQTNGWKITEAPLGNQQGTIVAQQDTPTPLQVSVAIAPNAATAANPSPNSAPETTTAAGSEFTIRYSQSGAAIGQTSPSPSPTATVSPGSESSQSEVFLGEEGTSAGTESTSASPQPIATLPANQFQDLTTTPQNLRSYVANLAQLGVLNLSSSGNEKTTRTNFLPNKPVSRRDYARWLFEANNQLFRDRPGQQIRLANPNAQPAFRDVPRTDPDFAVIQGLAEAGIIPSSLSGAATTVTFRPEAQLSRETMLLWKVPIDTRQPLPTASLDAIKQTWGFQDAARIDPTAQRAVLADFQNGDLSNIRRVFGYTTLLQPKRPVTRAEAAAALWYFGYQGDGVSAQDILKTQ